MNDEQLYNSLTEIDNLRENIGIVVHAIQQYALHTYDDLRVFNKTLTTLADCIDMYVARLKVETDRALKVCSDRGAVV